MEKALQETIAEKLRNAESSRVPIEALSTTYPDLSIMDGYAIQLQVASQKNDSLVGYKVGLTSLEAQKQFSVFEPDFGHLFKSMQIEDGGELNLEQFIQPMVEGEIAFVLEKELRGPGLKRKEIEAAVGYAMASIEVVDSRVRDWKVRAVDTIADNGSSAAFVLGKEKIAIKDVDLPLVGMALSVNGEVTVSGAGAAVMGDPLNAIVFLANALGEHGVSLEPGAVILSGSLGSMLKVKPGTHYKCEFSQLGAVSLKSSGAV